MKKELVLFAVAMLGAASISACNKQKAPRLDYAEKMKTGLFSPNGLPGENHVGATDEEKKFQGYSKQANSAGVNDAQTPEEAKELTPAPAEEKKPEAKEVKPAPAEAKKPEAKEAKPAPAEEKKPEAKEVKPAPAEEKKPEAKDTKPETKSSSEQKGSVR